MGRVATPCSAATYRSFSRRSTLRFAKRSEVLLGRVAATCRAATRRNLAVIFFVAIKLDLSRSFLRLFPCSLRGAAKVHKVCDLLAAPEELKLTDAPIA